MGFTPPGVPGAPFCWGPGLGCAGPALDMWKFFMRWIISGFMPPALGGLRAALTLPRGVEEVVMFETTEEGFEVDAEGISV